ncbi:MAG: PAS domain-containing protein [Alphaproteobacteria bacterium]|nr:PAS domain-containing protein [Alphaproteobacteria bacterium]HPF45947.1 ATP-binding protein [Emcibacteraceae bacterium]HRW29322.1 ATP-binding protein [Emcibacteraceae bacterium]
MGFKRFSLLLTIRLVLLFITVSSLAILVISPGFLAASLLVAMVAMSQIFEIVRFVKLTNDDLTRFLDAMRYGDFGQKFDHAGMGAGFIELGEAITDILERFRQYRGQQEEELKHLKALIEHVPVPLMSIKGDGTILIHNNAARRLFGSVHVAKVADLTQFGEEFRKRVLTLEPGERHLVTIKFDNIEQTLTIASTQIITAGKVEKIISLQDIQSELDVAQLKAWQDLVRVLTHEIMNSITPVSSLAKTSTDLVDDVIKKADGQEDLIEELTNVRDAVDTVARRSDSLMHFVQSYRRLTRLPPPEKEQLNVNNIVDDVIRIAAAGWTDEKIKIEKSVSTEGLEISADREMLEQMLINLIKNAEQALKGRENAKVGISAKLNKRGRIVIEVSDNGPGIPDDLAAKIFVPFYTTKRDGSGVGLALTRQVMIAHGGSVSLAKTEGGGATFILTF